MTDNGYKWKSILVSVAVMLIWLCLFVRLGWLHLGPNTSLKAKIERLHSHDEDLRSHRGRIFDRRGNLLAQDLPTKDIHIDPKVLQSNRTTRVVSVHLERLLGVPRAEILARANKPNRRDETIARNLTDAEADKVMRLRMPGVFARASEKRHYPLEEEACHVIGFSNAEGVGSAGIEQRYDDMLQGRSGHRKSQRDGRHREIYGRRTLEILPEAGADVHLTLDQTIQHYAERGMDHALEEYHCDAAWAIVEDVRTGQILAMACRPSYDLNAYPTSTAEQRRNRAVSVNYEPGSVFKTLTVAAGINEGLIATNDVFDCEMGRWTYLGRPLKDFHPYGELDVTGILRKSSNVGAAKIAVMVGEKKLDSYLRAFGIGRRTGIELPGEEAGLLAPVNRWSKLDITRIAMGHTVAVTALQILNALCCIGNDGILMQPYIVSKVVAANGTVLAEHRPRAVGRPITERTARLMREMLVSVTQPGGTGTRAAIEGYAIAGKTGSAEKLENGHYSKTKNMASFMGLIPAEKPQIGIVVVLDNPHPLRTGGVSAAPVFRYIAEPVVHYLDIRPSDASDTLRYVPAPGGEGWEPAPEDAVDVP